MNISRKKELYSQNQWGGTVLRWKFHCWVLTVLAHCPSPLTNINVKKKMNSLSWQNDLLFYQSFFLKSRRVLLTSYSSNVFLYLKKYQQKCLYTSPLFILFIWDPKPITLANKLVKTVITVKCNVVFFKQWKLNGNHKMYTMGSSPSTDILKISSSFLRGFVCLCLFCCGFLVFSIDYLLSSVHLNTTVISTNT